MYFSVINNIKKNIRIIGLFSLITLLAYGLSLNNKFVWDDEQFIYNNSYVKQFLVSKLWTENTIAGAGETSTYYRPLTTFSFAIDHAIWGLNPFGFHLTNTLLHLSSGILLFFYLKVLKFSKKISFFIASVFLVHPIQTEAVVYANSRGDSMYAFWTMIALLSFALLIKDKIPRIQIYDFDFKINKSMLFLITIISYLLAILGKEIGIASFGLILLTYLSVIFERKHSIKKILSKEYILSNLTIFLSVLTAIFYFIARNKLINISNSQEDFFIGTRYGESLFVRLHTFTEALWTYFQLLLFPYPLHMERSLEIVDQPISIWIIGIILLLVALTFLAIKEYKNNNTTYIAFGSLWFLGMLSPVSGIIPINGLIYEHWLYIPMIGFFITLYGITIIIFKKEILEKIKKYFQNILPFVICIYIVLTIRQNYLWSTPIRFYTYTLQFTQTARLRNNLAMAHADEGNYSEAISNYEKAIEISDFYPQTHHNLANVYVAIGENELAKEEFKTAIRMNKNFMPSYVPLIQLLIKDKDFENAANLLKILLDISPNNPEIQFGYAQMLVALGKTEEAKIILKSLETITSIPTQFKILIKDALLQLK